MRNLILCCMVLTLSWSIGFAQNNKSPKGVKQTTASKAKLTSEQKASATVEKMKAACSLKPEQIGKIEAAYIEYYKKHDTLKKQKDILSKDVYEQREEDMKKARNTVLKATLTAGQYKQWSSARDKEKESQKKGAEEE